MIPIFRAKHFRDNIYFIGSLIGKEDEYYIVQDEDMEYHRPIDITTLAINFDDMLDSQGNKIFASLSEDGKGGDILDRSGMTFKTIYKSVNGRFEAYETDGMHHLLAHKFHQSKVIGIQQ